MKTENIHALIKSNDAEYDDGAPSALYIPGYAMGSIKRRARELQSACYLANASCIEDYEWEDGIAELNGDNEEVSSGYQFYLRVWKGGSFDLIGYSKYNDDSRVTAHLGSIADAEANIGVSFMLSDGNKKMPVRVAYNGAVASGEMLIYSETAFGGAAEAPIAILLTDGKLDVRVWQPKDMGTDPSAVNVVEPYGVYDMEAIACDLKEIGSEEDYDQLFRQKGFDDGGVAATAKIDVDGETYDIVVGVAGDQEVYANYEENYDEEEILVPLHEDGTQKRLRREPLEFMKAKTLESESGSAYLAWHANCWLNIEILKNGESVGNYGDQFGSSFGSIQECFEAVCEDDIRQMLGVEASKDESPSCSIYKRYCIVQHINDDGSETLEDYSDEETCRKAFEAIRTNDYHVSEYEDRPDAKITFEEFDKVVFTIDIELWDERGNHVDFEAISFTPIVMHKGEVILEYCVTAVFDDEPDANHTKWFSSLEEANHYLSSIPDANAAVGQRLSLPEATKLMEQGKEVVFIFDDGTESVWDGGDIDEIYIGLPLAVYV